MEGRCRTTKICQFQGAALRTSKIGAFWDGTVYARILNLEAGGPESGASKSADFGRVATALHGSGYLRSQLGNGSNFLSNCGVCVCLCSRQTMPLLYMHMCLANTYPTRTQRNLWGPAIANTLGRISGHFFTSTASLGPGPAAHPGNFVVRHFRPCLAPTQKTIFSFGQVFTTRFGYIFWTSLELGAKQVLHILSKQNEQNVCRNGWCMLANFQSPALKQWDQTCV